MYTFSVSVLKTAALGLWAFCVFMPAILTIGTVESLVYNLAEEAATASAFLLFVLCEWRKDVRIIVAACFLGALSYSFGVNGQAYAHLTFIDADPGGVLHSVVSTIGIFSGFISVGLMMVSLFGTHQDVAYDHLPPTA
jgi:hypothetical protein